MSMLTRAQGRIIQIAYTAGLAFKAARDGKIGDIFQAIGTRNQNTWEDLSAYFNQAKEYTRNPWLYIAINRLAETGSLVQFNVFKLEGERKTPQVNHPLENLLRQPNGLMAQMELMESTIIPYMINGNAYWLLNGSTGSAPEELFPLRPDRMRIVAGPSRSNPVAGYVYEVDGLRIPLETEEIVHFKRVHPVDDLYGLSPMLPAQFALQSDNKMAEWNRNYFGRDNAVPAGILNIKQAVTPKQFDQIKAEWRDSYGGTNRRTAVLQAAETEYQNVGLSHKDMDFIAGREFERKIVFNIYGVPIGLLDFHGVKEDVQAQIDNYTNQTLWPLMNRLAARMTIALCPFWGDNLIVEPEDIRKSESERIKDEMVAYSPILSINELRQKYLGLEPVDWGEVPPSGAGAAVATATLPLSKNTGVSVEQLQGQSGGGSGPASLESPNRVAARVMEGSQGRPGTGEATKPKAATTTKALTRAQQRELEQFARYARKGKDIDAFTFLKFNASEGAAYKALVGLTDDHIMDALLVVDDVKAARISISGVHDPLTECKNKHEKALRSVLDEYFRSQANDLAQSMGSYWQRASVSETFWSKQQASLESLLSAKFAAMMTEELADLKRHTGMTIGLTFDEAACAGELQLEAGRLAADTARDVTSTTREGVNALVARLTSAGGDFAEALSASPLFTQSRAALVATTTVTAMAGGVTLIGAARLAHDNGGSLKTLTERGSNYIPAHPNCRCFWAISFDLNTMNVTMIYNTVQDERVCPLCEPRDGLTLTQLENSDNG